MTFFHKCQTPDEKSIEVRGPSILYRRLTWGPGGEPLSRRRLIGIWERSPPRLGDFNNFSIKMKHFETYLNLKLCFKTYSDTG